MTSHKGRNLLAALVLLLSSIGFGATAFDPFSGSGALTTGWTNIRTGLDQQAGNLRSTSAFGIALRSDISPGADQYSAAIVGINAADIYNGNSHLFVRLQDVDNYYEARLGDFRHDADLYRCIAGSCGAAIYTVAMPASIVAGDTIRMNISSAHVITLYRNGTLFGTYDDAAGVSSLTTGGVGLGLSGTASDSGVWAYWEGGDGGGGGGCTAPTVTVDPSNASVYEPATANFTATVTGTTPTYQWQRGTSNVSTGSGGTTLSYTTAATTVAGDNGATFRLIASNACGADTSAAATLTVSAAPTSGLPYSEDFERNTTDSTNWAARPNGDENSAGCCGVTNIGKGSAGEAINRIGRFGLSHSGSWTNRIIFTNNEDEARARVNNINADSMFARFWVFFDPDYDHAFGEKFVRFVSTDSTGVNGCSSGSLFWDLIFFLRTTDPPTAGKDNMVSIIGEANGGSGGAIGGGAFIQANIAFPRGVWFEVAFKVHLNGPGDSTGSASIWYNDSLIANQTGIYNMRTSSRNGSNSGACTYDASTDTHKITSFNWVGWYSNGSGGAPNVPAIKYIDDVCAQTTKCASLVGGGTPPTVTVDPSSTSKYVGQTATFSVTATGDPTLTYQWKKDGVNVSGGSGGTSDTYTTGSLVLGDNGAVYTCVVTNGSGSDTSAGATLTVTAAPASANTASKSRVGIGVGVGF